MDYGNLINKAFNLAWKHKILWVLGFFAASWGYVGSFDIEEKLPNFSRDWFHDFEPHFIEGIKDWIIHGPGLAIVIMIIGFAFILGLALFILHLMSVAGLIEGVVRIERGNSHKLKELFGVGAHYFWRFLGLFFLALLVGAIFFFLMILPTVVSIAVLGVVGILMLIIVIPVSFAGIFFFGNLYSLAQREMVIYNAPVFEAIKEGYNLLIKHLGPNIIIFLITTFLWIAIVISGLILTFIFAIPAVIIGAWSALFMILALIVILPVFLLVAIVVEGFLGTFFNSLFTYFYLELRKLTPHKTDVADNIAPASDGL